jgi:hypothetical protein
MTRVGHVASMRDKENAQKHGVGNPYENKIILQILPTVAESSHSASL